MNIITVITTALTVAGSAAVWLLGSVLYREAALPTGHAPGIDIIYPPAGLRTLLLIVGGVWAAIGVSIANLVLTPAGLGLYSFASVILFAFYTGIAPFVAIIGSFKLLGVAPNLTNLAPRHLPVLCFGTALGSSVLHVFAFCLIGTVPWNDFITATAAMVLGDFTGCLVVVLAALGVIKTLRAAGVI